MRIFLGTIVVPHNMKFAFRIVIQNVKKYKNSDFGLYILSHGTQSGTQSFRIEKYDVSL